VVARKWGPVVLAVALGVLNEVGIQEREMDDSSELTQKQSWNGRSQVGRWVRECRRRTRLKSGAGDYWSAWQGHGGYAMFDLGLMAGWRHDDSWDEADVYL